MSKQQHTGKQSEQWVLDKIIDLGLKAYKPVPDRGVDLIVSSPTSDNQILKIQVKGRGKIQNKRFRWFQIRANRNQREETQREGLPLNEAWRKKVALVDIFIFVSLVHREFWIFDANEIESLILINRPKYQNRKDNQNGKQAEIDLDNEYQGTPLTEIYRDNLNNWNLITNHFHI